MAVTPRVCPTSHFFTISINWLPACDPTSLHAVINKRGTWEQCTEAMGACRGQMWGGGVARSLRRTSRHITTLHALQ